MTSYDVSTTAAEFVPVEALAELRKQIGDFLLIGAVNLDLIAHGLAGLSLGRITRDVDVAVAVSSVGEYWRRVEPLADPGGISFRFRSTGGVLVDVLPFGPIANRSGDVLVGEDHVNVTGIAEAFDEAVLLDLGRGLVVRSASLAGMVVLKLIAWRTRGSYNSDKDLLDVATLLQASCSGVFEDECWADDEALAACDYDLFAASAYRIGRRISANFASNTQRQVRNLLVGDTRELLHAKLTPGLASATDRLDALIAGLARGAASSY